ncbi:hypothetical protein BO83DRAFT_339578 [Aspergillus eucalypticola CBS 122712]|uniref:Rhodopsin domain-containing protein n=1 Tax=Aspergillus eucalypticola (strain CBS 122712 / IBT 29274) TaxID=1448314 RepID=A0A317VA29_ASPEC|nr:uncharacterized protein BO83DRAFT_339578 [Aspergillus eucalypticola CBS 122712]PWY71184.1 hypothetical protein BO83DRAFT_339578 [Aspergillus eucalypticola CBS 122712]
MNAGGSPHNGIGGNSTTGSPPPKPSSAVNFGPELLAAVWTMSALSIIVVAMRSFGNAKFGNFQISDIVTLLALALLVIAAALSSVAVDYGYGKTASSLELHHAMSSLKYSTISQAVVTLAATAGRLAFIIYLIELLAARKLHRIILWTLVPLQVVVNVISVFLLLLQCSTHVEELFNPSQATHCMSLKVQIDYAYFQGAFNSACDLLLAAFPIYIFWRFNWNVRVKLVLVSLLSLGVVAMAASLVKTIEYPTIMTSTNPRTNHVTLLRWMFVEAGVVLITASIPCLRPLIVHWVKKFIKRAPTLHRKMDNGEVTQSTTLNVSQMTQDWKKRWIMPYMQQSESGENLEQHILANISTHIFAGDREFLDRHVPGIVKKVEVTVVADEIPLTEVEHT